MAKCYFKAVKNNKNFDFFQNVISVATLIRAYLDEKPSEINTRSYMFIRKCRVVCGSTTTVVEFHSVSGKIQYIFASK